MFLSCSYGCSSKKAEKQTNRLNKVGIAGLGGTTGALGGDVIMNQWSPVDPSSLHKVS